MIGHEGHPEVEGTLGRHNEKYGTRIYLVQDESDALSLDVNDPDNLAYVTQTTLSLDDTAEIINILNNRFPNLYKPKSKDICYATQNRQDAVKQIALEVEMLIVIGSTNSSNSNRLKELAERCNIESVLIDNADDIDWEYIDKFNSIGITAGASAPESTVQDVIKSLEGRFDTSSTDIGVNNETIYFKLPPELR